MGKGEKRRTITVFPAHQEEGLCGPVSRKEGGKGGVFEVVGKIVGYDARMEKSD